jgi:small subunit ribosomal protein S7
MWRNKRISIIKSFFWKEVNKKENLPSIIFYFKKLSVFKAKKFEKFTAKLKKKRLIKDTEKLFFLNSSTWVIWSTRRYKLINEAHKKVYIDKIKYFWYLKLFFFRRFHYRKTLYSWSVKHFIQTDSLKEFFFNINFLIKKGKKIFVLHVFRKVLFLLKYQFNVDLFLYFQYVIKKLIPSIYFYIKYASGRKYKIPCLISKKKSYNIALKWFFMSIKVRNESTLFLRLCGELSDFFNFNRGVSLKWKKEVYKIARENRAFIFLFKNNSSNSKWK